MALPPDWETNYVSTEGWRKMMCLHPETSAVDDEGYAICTTCNAPISVLLTLVQLENAMRRVLGRGTWPS